LRSSLQKLNLLQNELLLMLPIPPAIMPVVPPPVFDHVMWRRLIIGESGLMAAATSSGVPLR